MKKDKPIEQLRPEEAQKQFASYFEKIAYRKTVIDPIANIKLFEFNWLIWNWYS